MREFTGFLFNKNNLFFLDNYLSSIKSNNIWFEIGSGNGEYITQLAMKFPDDFFIATEIKWKRIFKICKKIKNLNIDNIIVLHGYGDIFVELCLKNESIQNFILNFPDPWFKKRHKKRRVLNSEFFKIMWQKLKNNGNIYIATDYEEYAQLVLYEARKLNIFDNADFTDKWLFKDILTKYEKIFLNEGKEIFYLHLIKKKVL